VAVLLSRKIDLVKPTMHQKYTISYGTLADNRKRKRPGKPGLFRQYRTILECAVVAMQGIEGMSLLFL